MTHLQSKAQTLNEPQNAQRAGYWPGHVIPESLVDEPEQKVTKKELESSSTDPGGKIKPGSAFSALIPSMVPVEILNNIESLANNDEFTYDQFGFRIENASKQTNSTENQFIDISLAPAVNSSNLLNSKLFIEDSKHKLKWIAYLEFTLNADIGSSFSWEQVVTLNRCEKLRGMIRGQGVPHSLRPFIWMRLSGALQKKQNSKFKYVDLFKNSEQDLFHTSKQIEKDLLRTLPTNACFYSANSVGVPRLRRILQSIAWLYPNIGYCQGMGTIVASLLLYLEEEDTFWLMCSILEDLLPASYFSHNLLGVQADMKVLRQLIATYLPEIDLQFKKFDIELSLVCINWFLTLFSNVFHMRILLRVWDLFFYEGSTALFQITLAMLKLHEESILKADSSSNIFTCLSDLPGNITNIDLLIETSIRIGSSVNKTLLDSSRRKHQAYLMAQNGQIALIKERAQFRHLESSNSQKNVLFKLIKKSNDTSQLEEESNEAKMKNIFQTEVLVNLREIIIKIAHHFQTQDPEKYLNCNLNADYSIDSHNRDYEFYMDTSKIKNYKRAKALLDFEKSDEDELGFKKNDIITVLSTKDDHCWIGELNGEKGWFPSRFVSLIDERNGKVYSAAGDDSISDRIRDLIRGEFSLAIKSIFEHGIKKWSVLGSAMHPWSFIEEAAKKVVEKDFESVYSRLILCKTYRLDEDGKVLTPDELLFRSIQMINLSHDVYRASMDVKLRSLICVGLNEQVLHIWLETLCSSIETVEKWYHKWSFIRSPGWVQIKCELRILAQFSFLLGADAELPESNKDLAINECIKDMLVKHHLFSWEI